MGDIVPTVYDGDDLQAAFDLLAAEPSTKGDVDLLHAFLDEVATSESSTWELLKWDGENHVSPYFNCKAIRCFHADGFNLYRVRPLTIRLKKYRIIYAYDRDENEIHLLYIVIPVKDSTPPPPPELHYDYSAKHIISSRIRSEYERIGIPKL